MSADLRAMLQERVNQGHARVVEWRRTIHANPELAYQEHQTAALCAQVLRDLGAEVRTGLAGTGVVGILRGRGPGKTIAVRADMDALPLTEQSDVRFASKNPGVMHACGHDSHVAMALGAAQVLAGLRDQFDGQVMIVCEPNEETLDSQQEAGAYRLVRDERILDEPHVDLVLGQHVYPEWPAGQVALRAGTIMTGYDYVDLAIIGTTAHTSTSHKGADAIVAAAQVITALQTIASRELDPMESAIVHLGTISGGTKRNILADRVDLTGTIRISDQRQRDSLQERIERIVAGITSALRCSYEITFERVLPAVQNDPEYTAMVGAVATELYGPSGVDWMSMPRPTAESFHIYSDHRPAVFWLLGVGNAAKGWDWASHHPRFMLDEDGMKAGVAVLAGSCLRALGAF